MATIEEETETCIDIVDLMIMRKNIKGNVITDCYGNRLDIGDINVMSLLPQPTHPVKVLTPHVSPNTILAEHFRNLELIKEETMINKYIINHKNVFEKMIMNFIYYIKKEGETTYVANNDSEDTHNQDYDAETLFNTLSVNNPLALEVLNDMIKKKLHSMRPQRTQEMITASTVYTTPQITVRASGGKRKPKKPPSGRHRVSR